jgi:hypothetical protein
MVHHWLVPPERGGDELAVGPRRDQAQQSLPSVYPLGGPEIGGRGQ